MRFLVGVAVISLLQALQAGPPQDSPHIRGPHGLEAWVKLSTLNDTGQQLPMELVVVRHGKVVRQIHGNPFVWEWMFTHDGRYIAYETAALHGPQEYILRDIDTGRIIDRYHSIDAATGHEPPAWATEVDKHPSISE